MEKNNAAVARRLKSRAAGIQGISFAGWPARWRAVAVILVSGAIAFGLAVTAAPAETRRAEGKGVLTAIRDDGTVIINEVRKQREFRDDGTEIIHKRGYRVSPRVLVLESGSRRTTLEKFQIPAMVSFEYVFTPEGPEIRLIRETELPGIR